MIGGKEATCPDRYPFGATGLQERNVTLYSAGIEHNHYRPTDDLCDALTLINSRSTAPCCNADTRLREKVMLPMLSSLGSVPRYVTRHLTTAFIMMVYALCTVIGAGSSPSEWNQTSKCREPVQRLSAETPAVAEGELDKKLRLEPSQPVFRPVYGIGARNLTSPPPVRDVLLVHSGQQDQHECAGA